ncbi:YhbY family RNA-binding protein [Aerococcus urinae]|uniref:YhbY family RNA-binding protein n=1 Tax=Aerococcus urinae TaxID=1376 RepID=UPI00227B4BA2|nr:YhbY family RNA-binding protein [Aerococcus urinae]MCY3045812.1 YhbY family RNA-binding protein [Aerococcus urinae]
MLINKQKKAIKKAAHHEKAILQIEKNGLKDELMEQIDQALEKRELVKISVLQNAGIETDQALEAIDQTLAPQFVYSIGHTIVLYRTSSEEKNQKLSKEIRALKNKGV